MNTSIYLDFQAEDQRFVLWRMHLWGLPTKGQIQYNYHMLAVW